MKVDRAGIDFIKNLEGFREKPYRDQAGVWTIGYGHTYGVTQFDPIIDIRQAEILLEEDLDPVEEYLSKPQTIGIPLTQSEFNALASFVFNLGPTRFEHSTLRSRLNLGDKRGAANQFERWVYVFDDVLGERIVSNGLLNRRKKEKELFLSSTKSLQAKAEG